MRKLKIIAGLSLLFMASQMQVEAASKNWTVNGRIKQGVSVLYDLNQGDTLGPANYLGEVKFSWRPNRQLTMAADFWLRGDWRPSFGDPIHDSGNHDPSDVAGLFNRRLPFDLYRNDCNGSAINSPIDTSCAAADEVRQFNNLNEIIRELSLKFRDKKGRFTIKVGKQQRGWGQSDGLRLMDILHAQDLRERFAFRDSDELRIPAFMISSDFNFRKMGISKPFEALGMKRPVLEFNFTPEVHHSAFNINNPTQSTLGGPTSGGVFGLPYPDVIDPVSGAGFVGFGFDIRDRNSKRWSFDEAEYSMRLKFDTLGGQATINAFYGQQDLPTVDLVGGTLIVGNAFNNTNAAAAALPLSAADVASVVNGAPGFLGPGTGGYLAFLRQIPGVLAGTAAPSVASPLTTLTGGLTAAGLLPADGSLVCQDPLTGAGTAACSINGIVDLNYRHRQRVLGFTFARDMSEFKFGRKQTSAALRFELSYEFGKTFNRSKVNGPATGEIPASALLGIPAGTLFPLNGITETGSPALAQLAQNAITKSDVLSTMIGFDYPLWIPGWEGQNKSIFTSFQFFNIHTFDADEGLLQQAPYAFAEVSKDAQFLTFLWNAPLDDERLVLEGLYIRDFDNAGNFYRQRIDFNYFGRDWRPRLEWMHFNGTRETAPIGLFDDKDFIELSLTYQF